MLVKFKDLKTLADKELNKDSKPPVIIHTEVGDITIKQYTPILEIRGAIDDIVKTSFLTGAFNPVLFEVAIRFAVVTLYTDIVFTAKEKQEPYKIFDAIETLDLYQKIIDALPSEQYTIFMRLLEDTVEYEVKHRSSLIGLINETIAQIPSIGEAAVNGLQGIEPEKLSLLMDIITANSSNKTEQ